MNIISIYPFPDRLTHDTNTAIIRDGIVSYAYEEAKLSRVQHDGRSLYPMQTLWDGLIQSGLTPEQIDAVVFTGRDPARKPMDSFFAERFLRDTGLDGCRGKAKFYVVDHHRAHAALACLTSPWKECAYLSMDGGGDVSSAEYGFFKNNRFTCLGRTPIAFNAGIFYLCLTYLSGFGSFEEGKTMGLAAYGKPDDTLYNSLMERVRWAEDGISFLFDVPQDIWKHKLDYTQYKAHNFRHYKIRTLSKDYLINTIFSLCGDIFKILSPEDIAATAQKVLENLVVTAVGRLVEKTGLRNIALSGGVFQNVILNKTLSAMPQVEDIYIPMAVYDGGLSLGGALYYYHKMTGERSCSYPVTSGLGPEYTDDAIESLLKEYRLDYMTVTDTAKEAAEAIASGRIVGWFQGRGEYGPRALGHRSVLADPRDKNAKAKLNMLLKKRDWFMPYAPSILEGHAAEYLEMKTPSDYMCLAYKVHVDKAEKIRTAVHIDGTARAQIVRKNTEPLFHRLIEEFYALSGIPMVLNTSFNRHGYPTNGTPKDAIEDFLRGCIDCLFIGSFRAEQELSGNEEKTHLIQSEEDALRHIRLTKVIALLASRDTESARRLFKRYFEKDILIQPLKGTEMEMQIPVSEGTGQNTMTRFILDTEKLMHSNSLRKIALQLEELL